MNKKINKILFQIILFLPVVVIFGFVSKSDIKALTWQQPYYDVDININEDSTFSVTESAEFIFTGTLNGLRRDITLFDSEKNEFCATNGNYTCGGFEFITFQNLKYNGEEQYDDDFDLYEITEESGTRYFRIEKRIHDPEKYVVKEKEEWEFTYNVFGGIQWIENLQGEVVPFFYWNLLPESRGALTESSIVKIQMPSSVSIDTSKFIIYDYASTQYTIDVERSTNTIILEFENLPSYSFLTASYEFDADELIEPATIDLDFVKPTLGGVDTFFNGYQIYANQNNQFEYFPAGSHEFRFTRMGYQDAEVSFDLESASRESIEVELEPKLWMTILLFIGVMSLIFGIISIPILLFVVYARYMSKGVDKNMPKTIIPRFQIPGGLPAYLVGSIVDEKVDDRDITGTIIDLAYRGYLKIKELKKGKDYELIKQDKDQSDLDARELELLNIFFVGKKDTFKTSSITLSVATKLNALKKEIDKDLKEKGYFTSSPNFTRSLYFGVGVLLLVLGVLSAVLVTIFFVTVTGELNLFTFGFALVGMGLSTMFVAKYMPAKTESGSKIYAEILGFKMYLKTAERFRLKDLTPEEFEKFLSYAIVLGVEKEWAKHFKEIYKQQPDWYEGSSLTDAMLVSSFSRSFSNATTSQIRSVTSASSGSGGGWSGGGGSGGGFSGGGGGGGSSGGW